MKERFDSSSQNIKPARPEDIFKILGKDVPSAPVHTEELPVIPARQPLVPTLIDEVLEGRTMLNGEPMNLRGEEEEVIEAAEKKRRFMSGSARRRLTGKYAIYLYVGVLSSYAGSAVVTGDLYRPIAYVKDINHLATNFPEVISDSVEGFNSFVEGFKTAKDTVDTVNKIKPGGE